VSPCNPPCSSNERCDASGECFPLAPAAAAPVAAPQAIAAVGPASGPVTPPADAWTWALSVGGVWVPADPGATWGGLVEFDFVKSLGDKNDVRLGFALVHTETYYSTATEGLLAGRWNLNFGPVYSLGVLVALGAGSVSPKDGYNADNGGSLVGVLGVVPLGLRLGPAHNVELSLQVGLSRLFSFGETDPFGGIFVGYVGR
jgi:hypothetical protein